MPTRRAPRRALPKGCKRVSLILYPDDLLLMEIYRAHSHSSSPFGRTAEDEQLMLRCMLSAGVRWSADIDAYAVAHPFGAGEERPVKEWDRPRKRARELIAVLAVCALGRPWIVESAALREAAHA